MEKKICLQIVIEREMNMKNKCSKTKKINKFKRQMKTWQYNCIPFKCGVIN